MKAISRRLRRLDGQQMPSSGPPRKGFGVMIAPTRRDNIDLEKSSCQRTLCADGSDGREVSDEELNEWIATFPIEMPDGRIRMRPLPPPE